MPSVSPSNENSGRTSTPPALEDAIADYLRSTEANPNLNPDRFLDRYPQWQQQLREFIESRRHVSEFMQSMLGSGVSSTFDAWRLPKRVGDYELIELVGRGGMGVVFKARQTSLDRCVALKMLGQAHDSGRFQAEAESAAALEHPNIVSIFDIGEHQGLPYFSMQFVDGGDLRSLLDQGPIAPHSAAAMTAKLAGAVEYAHQRGILHRDLKPGNVLIDRQGELYVADFGLARRIVDGSVQTQTGTVVGTPSYMAPEQASGNRGAATTAVDVYGLGALLYAMLTGRPPFEGEFPLQVIRQVIDDPPIPPRSIVPTVPRDLEMICLKCLEKRPEDRYHSAFDVQQDVWRFIRGEPVVARPLDWRGRMLRYGRRNPVTASLAAAVLVLMVAAAVGGSVLAWKEFRARHSAVQSGLREAQARREAEFQLIDAYMNQGRQAQRLSRQSESLLWYAHAADLAKGSPQFTDAMVRGLRRQRFVPQPMRAALLPEGLASLSFHPTGRYLLCKDGDSTLHVWDTHGLRLPTAVKRFGSISAVAWSPDGKTLALGNRAGQLRVLDMASGLTRLERDLAETITAIQFDPNGQWLVAASGARGEFYDLADGVSKKSDSLPDRCCELDSPIVDLAVNPSGTHLLVLGENGTATVFEIGNPLRQAIAPFPHRPPTHVNRTKLLPFFVDDVRVATLDGNELRIIHATNGETLLTQSVAPALVWEYEPQKKCLAIGSYRQTQLWDLETGELRGQLRHREPATAIAFRPGFNSLAGSCLDGRVNFWDLATGRSLGDLQHQAELSSLEFSPDGQSLATAQLNGLARIWRMTQDTVRRTSFDNAHPEFPSRIMQSHRGLVFVTAAAWQVPGESVIERITLDEAGERLEPIRLTGELHDADTSSDGRILVAAVSRLAADSAESRGVLEVFRGPHGERQTTSLELPDKPRSVSLQPRGRLAAVALHNGEIVLIDVESSRIARRLRRAASTADDAAKIVRASFSPDGQWLVLYGDADHIDVYHQKNNWSPVGQLTASGPISHVEFAAGADRLLAVCGSRTVFAWELDSQRPSGPALRHEELVYQAHFSPDGQRIATACADNYARIFDVQSGELACQTVTHWVDVFDAAFSLDGRWLFTLGDNSLLGIWSARDGGFVDQLGVSADGTEGPAPLRAARIFVPHPGTMVAVAGRRRQIDFIQLGQFDSEPNLSSSQLRMIAELSANATIDRGGPRPLTTTEWIALWNDYAQASSKELLAKGIEGPDLGPGVRILAE